jgi:predicted SprT family Zn-dependent metalloprotease
VSTALRTDTAATEVIDNRRIATVEGGGLCGHCRGDLHLVTVVDGQRFQCQHCGHGLQFFVLDGQIMQKPWVCR